MMYGSLLATSSLGNIAVVAVAGKTWSTRQDGFSFFVQRFCVTGTYNPFPVVQIGTCQPFTYGGFYSISNFMFILKYLGKKEEACVYV